MTSLADPALQGAPSNMILLGAILAVSIVADVIARRTGLPRISLLVLVGVLMAALHQWAGGGDGGWPLGELAEPLINLALVMVAFLLGGELSLKRLRRTGAVIVVVSLVVLVIGALVVGAGLALFGYPAVVAISLAAISVATDPAAVREVVREYRAAHGDTPYTARVLLGIVAIDDAWGILSFALAVLLLGWLGIDADGVAATALWEVGGGLVVGALVGLPAAWLTGRLKPGEPVQVEALAVMLLLAGLSEWLAVSSLLAAMFAGFMVANLSRHHTRSFREIEHIEWPFMVFFFVLSGASVQFVHGRAALGLLVAFVVLRFAGRYFSGILGARIARRVTGASVPSRIGLALTPQAGVAIGMALLIAERYPQNGAMLVSVTVASTVVFELAGPFLVRGVLPAHRH